MSIKIGNYNFEGPYATPDSFNNYSGVYAVLSRPPGTGPYTVIDVGESGAVRERLSNHDRGVQWFRANMGGGIAFAVCHCDERSRKLIESELRAQYSPVCGVR